MKFIRFLFIFSITWNFLNNIYAQKISISVLCYIRPFGFFKHEYNCAKYYMCSNGITFTMECPTGLFFDDHFNICNWNESVKCNGNEEMENGNAANTDSTPLVTSTTASYVTEYTTISSSIDDNSLEEHETVTTTSTTTSSTEDDSSICYNNDFGCQAHPTDCTKFYHCQSGIAIEASCQKGMYFNPNGCYCDSLAAIYC